MISIEDLIWHLESLNQDLKDKGLYVAIAFLKYMRRNIAGRGTMMGFLSGDEYRDIKL